MACDADDVGEAWSAYQWIRRLGDRHEVTAFVRNKPKRLGEATKQLDNCKVYEWPDRGIPTRFERFNAMLKPGWIAHRRHVRRTLKHLLTAGGQFDLAHQIAPLALRYACPATGLGLPTIIGPLGGSVETPPGMKQVFNEAGWYMHLRKVDRWRWRHDHALRKSYEQANLVLGVAPYVQALLANAGVHLQRFEVESETGTPPSSPENHQTLSNQDQNMKDSTMRLLYVGRIVRSKGLRDAIAALALLKQRNTLIDLHLDVLGDGPDRAACETAVLEAGLNHVVTFHGRVPRQQVDDFYQQSDVFIFPSFREPSGNVVLEAMSWGLPVITSTIGGPGHVVTNDCGITVEPVNPDVYGSQLTEAILKMRDADRRRAMGRAARQHVADTFEWESKIDRMDRRYEQVLSQNA